MRPMYLVQSSPPSLTHVPSCSTGLPSGALTTIIAQSAVTLPMMDCTTPASAHVAPSGTYARADAVRGTELPGPTAAETAHDADNCCLHASLKERQPRRPFRIFLTWGG